MISSFIQCDQNFAGFLVRTVTCVSLLGCSTVPVRWWAVQGCWEGQWGGRRQDGWSLKLQSQKLNINFIGIFNRSVRNIWSPHQNNLLQPSTGVKKTPNTVSTCVNICVNSYSYLCRDSYSYLCQGRVDIGEAASNQICRHLLMLPPRGLVVE